ETEDAVVDQTLVVQQLEADTARAASRCSGDQSGVEVARAALADGVQEIRIGRAAFEPGNDPLLLEPGIEELAGAGDRSLFRHGTDQQVGAGALGADDHERLDVSTNLWLSRQRFGGKGRPDPHRNAGLPWAALQQATQ